MRPMTDVQMIVAVDERGGFAKDGQIPWSYKEDWKHFKATTAGAVCIMGRKTYQDIYDRKRKKDGDLLPGRTSYVITSSTDKDTFVGVADITTSVRQIMDKLPDGNTPNVFILGGENLFIEQIVWTQRIYMTIVPGIYNCDRKFPVDYIQKKFIIAEGEERDGLKFVTYHRKLK